ncbi:MAG: B12-binding domain-containing radical SAM protein [Magnetococcales bacterium]|nr:B12-binding domain-containing radical SAM protein [Magnetococcales bacterium]
MLRVALINPFTPDGNFVPPLGLLTLGAILEQRGHHVALLDQNRNPDIVRQVEDYSPHLIGLTAVTSAVLSARRLAHQLRECLPEVRVVFGGPHPTAMPGEVIGWPEVDFVVVAEGEIPLGMLADWLAAQGDVEQLERIPGLWYKDAEGGLHANPAGSFLSGDDLDRLPRPAYHLLDVERVVTRIRHGVFRQGRRVLPYMASRGCPYLCTYCSAMMGRRMRRRRAELVLDDFQFLVDRYGIDEIYLEDDNFTLSRDYAETILDGIVARRLPVTLKFANGIRVDNLQAQMLEKMAAVGVRSLSFGLESGSPNVLRLMKKSLNLDRVRSKTELIRQHGFLLGASMIIGYPGETEADIRESYAFFKSLRLDSMAVVNLIPFPGTDVRQLCLDNHWLTEQANDWDNYYFDIANPKILIATDLLSQEQTRELLREIFFKFYLEPRRIMTLLRHMQVGDMVEGAKLVLRKLRGAG